MPERYRLDTWSLSASTVAHRLEAWIAKSHPPGPLGRDNPRRGLRRRHVRRLADLRRPAAPNSQPTASDPAPARTNSPSKHIESKAAANPADSGPVRCHRHHGIGQPWLWPRIWSRSAPITGAAVKRHSPRRTADLTCWP